MARWVGGLAVVVALVIALLLAPAGRMELVIRELPSRAPLARLPLAADARFTLRYVHSVDGTPVWEEHVVDRAGAIHVVEERFVLLGAGMGRLPGHGVLTMRDSLQVIEQIDRRVGAFVLRVGDRRADQTIVCGEHRLRLHEIAPDRAVLVGAERLRRIDTWRRRLERRAPPAVIAER